MSKSLLDFKYLSLKINKHFSEISLKMSKAALTRFFNLKKRTVDFSKRFCKTNFPRKHREEKKDYVNCEENSVEPHVELSSLTEASGIVPGHLLHIQRE